MTLKIRNKVLRSRLTGNVCSPYELVPVPVIRMADRSRTAEALAKRVLVAPLNKTYINLTQRPKQGPNHITSLSCFLSTQAQPRCAEEGR